MKAQLVDAIFSAIACGGEHLCPKGNRGLPNNCPVVVAWVTEPLGSDENAVMPIPGTRSGTFADAAHYMES